MVGKRRQFGYRKLFLITCIITFFLSSVADNLTAALLVGAVVMAVGADNEKFVSIGFVNLAGSPRMQVVLFVRLVT
jgi:Na+/H+ antiporter NhaD/arsenite permease-like protein